MTSSEPIQTLRARADLHDALRVATLGEYEVYHDLGHGGMASVYLAREIALDRLVAIKVLSPELLRTEGMVERFKREARTAASLNHPHIIPVYAVRETENLLFFVMKYVSGRALDLVLADEGQLDIGLAETILGQVGSALAYAHRRGVIHRDVKPGNIMLDEEGWAVVMDFGIAKVLDATSLTSTGSAVGTPLYMSPEQAGSEPLTAQSDQYSLGAVVYEMLTGQPPFTASSTMEVMRAHFFDPPVRISELRPDCPEYLASVVMRMLEKQQGARWPSLDDALFHLRGQPTHPDADRVKTRLITLARSGPARLAVPSVPTSPVPASRRTTAGKVARLGRRVRFLAGGAVLLAAVGGLAVLTMPGIQPEVGELPTPPVASATEDVVRVPEATPEREIVPERESGRIATSPSVPEAGSPSTDRQRAETRLSAPRPRPAEVPLSPSAPIASAAPAAAWVLVGTRREGAFIYLNGRIQYPWSPALRWFQVPVGEVRVRVGAESCEPVEQVHTVSQGDSLEVGWLFPVCPP